MEKEKFKLKKLEELLIEVSLKIAKRGEGAVFVVGEVENSPLVEQGVPEFNVFDNPKLLESLALMDGAVIISKDGYMKSYGVMIKSSKVLKNFGTRHSAAISASMIKGNLVVAVSEEDKKIRIMSEGNVVMQIDALQKDVEKSVPEAIILLESVGAGTVGAIGTGIVVPSLGITLLPGIILFGSAYYLMRFLNNRKK